MVQCGRASKSVILAPDWQPTFAVPKILATGFLDDVSVLQGAIPRYLTELDRPMEQWQHIVVRLPEVVMLTPCH